MFEKSARSQQKDGSYLDNDIHFRQNAWSHHLVRLFTIIFARLKSKRQKKPNHFHPQLLRWHLESNLQRHIAWLVTVHIPGQQQPRLCCKHIQVAKSLQMIPEEKSGGKNSNTYSTHLLSLLWMGNLGKKAMSIAATDAGCVLRE
jgi:hypothetical protein